MEHVNLDIGRESMPSSSQIITREEFEALMSELGLEADAEPAAPISAHDEKVRKLEFNLMVLVGLVLLVFILCSSG